MNIPALLLADTLVVFLSALVMAQQVIAPPRPPLQSSDRSNLRALWAETLLRRLL